MSNFGNAGMKTVVEIYEDPSNAGQPGDPGATTSVWTLASGSAWKRIPTSGPALNAANAMLNDTISGEFTDSMVEGRTSWDIQADSVYTDETGDAKTALNILLYAFTNRERVAVRFLVNAVETEGAAAVSGKTMAYGYGRVGAQNFSAPGGDLNTLAIPISNDGSLTFSTTT